ncbi:MAG: NADH:flavin oxidoreductase [Planctomycetota bacterium]
MPAEKYPKMAQLRTVEKFNARLEELGISIPCDEDLLSAEDASPLALPISFGDHVVGNRWCIHPMEGWDANRDGSPTDLTIRRWHRFGLSGAKLIWGGEAAAVQPTGRANPNQTLATAENEQGLKTLLDALLDGHRSQGLDIEDLLVGLQLTHSGRFCKPNDHKRWESRIAYHHPLLDSKFGIDPDDDDVVWTDEQLEALIDDYVAAAKLAEKVGFKFVDVKACHGYLLHEFLSARSRPGRFGGDLKGRSRVLCTVVNRIREECPSLAIGCRLSLFDSFPFRPNAEDKVGEPHDWDEGQPYEFGFGLNPANPLEIDLTEPKQLVQMLMEQGLDMLNITAASPYYNPHFQRPAIFPPSDGYLPPEDPLVGVARHLEVVADMKQAFPDLAMVGSGYSYLQEFLPRVAQAAVREGMVDFVGLGRMVLSYPTLPLDSLHGKPPERKLICRTFSDCTTAPRNGVVSGCYPLDEHYKRMPEREQVQSLKLT